VDTATIGIDLTAVDTKQSKNNILRNISIVHIDGIGLRVGPPDPGPSYQVSEAVIEKIYFDDVKTGVLQVNLQTANIHYRSVDVHDFSEYGMDFRGGPVKMTGCTFVNQGTAKADVRVRSSESSTGNLALEAVFQNNYHESNNPAYIFCDGPNCVAGDSIDEQGEWRVFPTSFIGVRVRSTVSGNIIDYRHAGSLNLIGCSFELINQGQNGFIYVAPPVGKRVQVASVGNFYDRRLNPGVKMLFPPVPPFPEPPDFGEVSVLANDNPTGVSEPGFLIADHTGLFSLWEKSGKLILYKPNARLQFFNTAGAITFKNDPAAQTTQLNAVTATAGRVVSLPDASGTVLLNSTRPEVCGSVFINPPLILSGQSGDGSASASGLAAGNACACSPAADWGEDLVMKYCNAGPGTLNVRIYNAGGDVDAPGQTVDFCCRQ